MMEQKAYIGNDSIQELVPILKGCAAKHILLVRGKDSYRACGAEEIVNNAVSNVGCTVTYFFDFSENPKCEDLERGLELLKNCGADCIIAAGGGSVMDMAKLIRFFHSYSGDITGKIFEKQKELLSLIVMPTTSGTGAEVTHFSVVYKNKVKYSAEHDDMLPDYAIIYPPFTYDNPKYLTACTGFDALAQAIEAYWNRNANEESDKYAELAIRLLWTNLPEVVNNPTEGARVRISEGAYWAGRAINITKTTAPHAFSYPFTSYYGYPHGHAVALTFPFFVGLNCGENNPARERVAKLLSLLGFDVSGDLQAQMQKYVDVLGLQMREGDIVDAKFILGQVNLDRLKNNPTNIVKLELLKLHNLVLK